jgi:hypothetical protein
MFIAGSKILWTKGREPLLLWHDLPATHKVGRKPFRTAREGSVPFILSVCQLMLANTKTDYIKQA